MIRIEKTADDRIDLQLNGKIDADEMRTALEDLLTLTEGMENGRMYYTITDFQIPDLPALAVEFRYLPRMFSLISRLDKVAVLSDQNWIRKAAVSEGKLIPGLEIRDFDLSDPKAAEDWLSEIG